MIEEIPPIIDVVTGTDWVAILSPIAAGIVGIAGTLLGGRMSGRSQTSNLHLTIEAEDRRIRNADKREVYAKCLAAFQEMCHVALIYRGFRHDGNEKKLWSTFEDMSRVRNIMAGSVFEVQLVAPEDVGRLAGSFMQFFLDHVMESDKGAQLGTTDVEEYRKLLTTLGQAMRVDLKEAIAIHR